MKRINAEGTTFFYFLPDDNLRQREFPLQADPPRSDVTQRAISNGARLVLSPSFLSPRRGHFYFLYWPMKPDLVSLDTRVTDGSYSDADFASSSRAVYQDTWCDTCGEIWPTLVIPPGEPYPGAPNLLAKKVASARFEGCPKCGAPFRQMVVKIFEGTTPGTEK